MSLRLAWALVCALALSIGHAEVAHAASGSLTLQRALQRALGANPRLTAAERDIGIAAGRRIQAGAIPNPDSLPNSTMRSAAAATGARAPPKRPCSSASSSSWAASAMRAIAAGPRKSRARRGSGAHCASKSCLKQRSRSSVCSGAQRRVQIFESRSRRSDRLTPLLQRRVDAGAASPAETAARPGRGRPRAAPSANGRGQRWRSPGANLRS